MKKIRSSRPLSFIVVAVAYLFAAAVGVEAFFALTSVHELWLRVLISDCLATLVIFIFSLIFDNASIYDPYWSVQPMLIVPCIIAFGGNISLHTVLLIVLVELWGLRLTANWAYLFDNLCVQDWRYDNIKNNTGVWYPLVSLLGIQMVPTLIVFSCMLPVIQLSMQHGVAFNALCLVGAVVSVGGILFELAADMQKHKYRRAGGRGIINFGLWKKHRHPNYFGEIIFWWGIYLFVAAVSPELWRTGVGALLNTLLFSFISIPMAEKQTSLRHPEEWESYKKDSFVL